MSESRFSSIDEIVQAINDMGGYVEDIEAFKEFMFEYGCQTAEFQGIDPVKAPGYVKHVSMQGALKMYYNVLTCTEYLRPGQMILIRTFPLDHIPAMVRRDHGM